jgi:hypothetical protein
MLSKLWIFSSLCFHAHGEREVFGVSAARGDVCAQSDGRRVSAVGSHQRSGGLGSVHYQTVNTVTRESCVFQIEHLSKKKIRADSINSKMGEKERKRVLADLSCKQPETRFLYVTPEQV